jgi:hypothetical protein
MRNQQRNVMPRWQRRLLFVCLALLVTTGGVWLSVHHLGWPAVARAEMEGLPSPWEHWLMQLHGAGVFVMFFLAGRVSAIHVKRGWRLERHRITGVMLVAALALLALSGYALFYLVSDDGRDALGLAHAAAGLLCAGVLIGHRRFPRH